MSSHPASTIRPEPGEYLDTPAIPGECVKVRIFTEEGDDQFPWAVDAVDERGRYTERIWKYATHDEAVAGIPEFCASFGLDALPQV